MAEPLPRETLDSALNPAKIAQQTFDHERRGFDQRQVQAYLRAVADSLRDAQQREADMRARLGKAIRRAELAEQNGRTNAAADPAELTRQLGDEVTSVLDAARAAGDQRIAAAEKSAEKLLANAKAEASRLRQSAETIMDERSAEADAAATEIIAGGRRDAEAMLEKARTDAAQVRAEAAADMARARDECDGLIREAEQARIQILEDMDRRRRQARAQVERLRVGRDRLLRSYDVVRRTLDETTDELKSSLKEAKVKGDTAARLVASEPLSSPEQLEAELIDARLIGAIRVAKPSTPAPLTSPALPRPLTPPSVPNIDLRTAGIAPDASPKPKRPNVVKPNVVKPSLVKSTPAAGGGRATPPKAPASAPILKAQPDLPEAADLPESIASPDAASPDTENVDAESLDTTPGTDGPEPADEAAARAEPASADNDDVTELVDHIGDDDGGDEIGSDDDVDEELAAELGQLVDRNLAVVEASDEIEEVRVLDDAASPAANTATATPAPTDERITRTAKSARTKRAAPAPKAETKAAPSLFAALREQSATEPEAEQEPEAIAVAPDPDRARDMARQRDAIVADAASQIERRLKRALADEQNDLLAGIRAARADIVELTALIGDVDGQLRRYVVSINEIAVVTYGAGAAMIDAQARSGELPAGAVEELLAGRIVQPIRDHLAELDGLDVESSDEHVDAIRSFYRQRKNDHLATAAESLAKLLCTAGVCDALGVDEPLPWAELAAH